MSPITRLQNLPSEKKLPWLVVITIATLIAVVLLPPIPQDLDYHNFADQRSILGLDNAMDVISNASLLFAGIFGLFVLQRISSHYSWQELLPWTIFALSVVLTSLGSSWYHLQPDNDSLFWDRLPMSVGFMALFSGIIAEHIHNKAGFYLLPALLLLGIGSVIYWSYTESAGAGDLRPYALAQFLPMVLIPLILLGWSSTWTGQYGFFAVLAVYLISKIFEFLDQTIFNMTNDLISGHSLKHMAAGIAAFLLYYLLLIRNRSNRGTSK